jgi:hypothetical protein
MGPIPGHSAEQTVAAFVGRPAVPKPLPPKDVPHHPFLSEYGAAHVDSYNSDVTDWPGPLGRDPEVISRSMGRHLGLCTIRAFHPQGHLSSICYYVKDGPNLGGVTVGIDLALFDPSDIRVLDLYEAGSFTIDLFRFIKGETVNLSGSYFFVDQLGRAVNAGAGNRIQIVEPRLIDGLPQWRLAESLDLGALVPTEAGNLIAVMPDFQGHQWFITTHGLVGRVDENTGDLRTTRLEGETFENAMAIAPDGIYVASDHALYRFEADPDTGVPRHTWRRAYPRATVKKPGMLSWGTGVTPTLLGKELVAITDNGDDRVNLLVYDRQDGERVCSVPLFELGAGVVEVSPIGYSDEGGRFNALVVQSNYGAPSFRGDYGDLERWLTRIDVLSDRSGCVEVWTNHEVPSTGVPKLSTATGLIYTFTQRFDQPVEKAWYFAALDFETGETVYMVSLGTGWERHNSYGTVDLGPDGTAYQGLLTGMVSIRDRE